jgi:predicted phosphodiesterase
MRIAVLSDIHANRTAFEAVLRDLRQTSPDVVFHGGDIADAGSSPVEIVDHIRALGWAGVLGNTDEMLFRPDSWRDFASRRPALSPVFGAVEEMAAVTRELLGEDRLAWLRELPLLRTHGPMALVHASPESPWRSPAADAGDDELESVYGTLGRPIAVFGHIHRPFVRSVAGRIVANCGSVGQPHDGDPRASYLLLDDAGPVIRRVEYDVSRELEILAGSALPHAGWVRRILESASPQMP